MQKSLYISFSFVQILFASINTEDVQRIPDKTITTVTLMLCTSKRLFKNSIYSGVASWTSDEFTFTHSLREQMMDYHE